MKAVGYELKELRHPYTNSSNTRQCSRFKTNTAKGCSMLPLVCEVCVHCVCVQCVCALVCEVCVAICVCVFDVSMCVEVWGEKHVTARVNSNVSVHLCVPACV